MAVPPATPKQPPHGRFLQQRREGLGWSIRQAAQKAGMSDSYWGQIERGYQAAKGKIRVIEPSVGSLLQCAGALRLTDQETNHLLDLAGFRPMPRRRESIPVGYDVDTTDLTKEQVAELNRLADLFRRSQGQQ
jgi:transcriptional regulator with XRE-family HTH domain